MSPEWKKRLHLAAEVLLAALMSLVAASVMTWPAAMHLDEVIIGGGELGGWLWRYWWHFTEVEALAEGDLGPIDTVMTFLSLGRHPETGNILDVLLISYPLSKLAALPSHYNLKIFVILMGDGMLGYLLARQFVSSRAVALTACVIAVINPINIQDIHGSGLRQVLLWWLLLFPILLRRAERAKTWGAGLLAGTVLGLAGAWYWFYGLFGAMFLGIYLVSVVARRWGRVRVDRQLPWVAGTIIGAALVGGFFALPYILGDPGTTTTAGQQSLPELTFFLPFPEYDVIRDVPLRPSTYEENVVSSLNRTIMSSWSVDYLFNPAHPRALPLVVFLFGVVPATLFWRQAHPESRLWLVVFLVFWLGTLGPFLKLGGDQDSAEVVLLGGEWVVRLPFTWMFRWVPGMSRMFGPYRMGSMVVVAAVVLVALGLIRIRSRYGRVLVSAAAILGTFLQVSYRWEVGPIAEGGFAPTMWRSPVTVSAIRVPDWYQELDPTAMGGIVELPLEQQQDLLYYYQLVHHQKVYKSWASPPAVPPAFRSDGGGDSGARMRHLATPDPDAGETAEILTNLSRRPDETALPEVAREDFVAMLATNNYRHVVIHERGYYLVDPGAGPLYYQDVVRRMEIFLQVPGTELVEFAWFDYPGNEYKVPDGPVYVPWASQEVNLSDRDMPSTYRMTVFDVGPLVDAYDGPLLTGDEDVQTGPTHQEMPHDPAAHSAGSPGEGADPQ